MLQVLKEFCNEVLHDLYSCCETDLGNCFSDNCPPTGCLERTDNYFDWEAPGIGRNILFFMFEGVVGIIVLLMLEFRLFERLMYFIQKSDVKIGTGKARPFH
jgi:hypothetical protein